MPKTLADYLALPYRLEITPGEHDEYLVQYPELPGCMTQVRRIEDVPAIAQEILTGWLEIALEDGFPIPLPEERPAYGGKILVRMPRSLHRRLAERAQREGVSLNQYVVSTLSRSEGTPANLDQRLDDIGRKLDDLTARIGDEHLTEAHQSLRRTS